MRSRLPIQLIINQKDILRHRRRNKVNATRIPLLLSLTRDIMFRITPYLLGSPLVRVGGGIGDGVCPQGSLDVGERGVFDVGGPAFFEEWDSYFCKGFALSLDDYSAEDVVAVAEVRTGEVIKAGGPLNMLIHWQKNFR